MNTLLEKSNKYKCFVILIFLNLFDGIATYIGLTKGFYIEQNYILSSVYQYNQNMFIIVKIIIPTVVLGILMMKIENKLSKLTKGMFCLANTVYTLLFIYHISLYTIVIKLATSRILSV